MDNKQFISRLSSRCKLKPVTVSALTESLAKVFTQCGSDLDTIAIPGFGTFVTEKHDEQITVDSVTGKRTLVPPVIRMTYKPSIILRKKL